MIGQYIDAAIAQSLKRSQVLKKKIPNPAVPRELMSLQSTCEQKLDEVDIRLKYLLEDELISQNHLSKERIRFLRRCMEDLDEVELGVSALIRANEDDVFMNRLIFKIHQEVNYPISPPVVSCISKDYFWINTRLRLMAVPPVEADFLLHMPDLYHEMAHLILSETSNPKTEPFRRSLSDFYLDIETHFRKRMEENRRLTGPKEYFEQILITLRDSWIIHWAPEIFCDLYAVATLGPAYAWSHFHLSAAICPNPFRVSLQSLMSHPPDHARMEALLSALQQLGYSSAANEIALRWTELLNINGAKIDGDYRKACPEHLLASSVKHALKGVEGIRADMKADSGGETVRHVLNEAWRTFWLSPSEYLENEAELSLRLRAVAE